MKRGNNLRVSILSQYSDGNCEVSFTEMIVKLLKSPSYVEKECCSKKETVFPIVRLHESFQNDFNNLQIAIEKNFPPKVICRKCKNPKVLRTFASHIFIEVNQIFVQTFILTIRCFSLLRWCHIKVKSQQRTSNHQWNSISVVFL